MGQALPDTLPLDFTLQAARLISLGWLNEGLKAVAGVKCNPSLNKSVNSINLSLMSW